MNVTRGDIVRIKGDSLGLFKVIDVRTKKSYSLPYAVAYSSESLPLSYNPPTDYTEFTLENVFGNIINVSEEDVVQTINWKQRMIGEKNVLY